MEVTDKDTDSPLVSYLLAKLQQLESKIMVRPNSRTTREVTQRSTKPSVVADNKQCNCQTGVVTYVRWGNSTCPYGADTIYSGVVAGSWYDYQGAAVDPLCLPPNPQYLKFQAGYQSFHRLFGAEYKTHAESPLNHINDRNVPCALCQAYGRTSKIMIPSRYECPSGWNTEYYGYLMAGHDRTYKGATQFSCVDKSFGVIPGSRKANNGGHQFYTVEAACNYHHPCSDKELTCVVRTR